MIIVVDTVGQLSSSIVIISLFTDIVDCGQLMIIASYQSISPKKFGTHCGHCQIPPPKVLGLVLVHLRSRAGRTWQPYMVYHSEPTNGWLYA
jgi:hypothetical protein